MNNTVLRYVEGTEPGYTRRKRGKGWQYLGPGGKILTSQSVIKRLDALALPPAYVDAWYAKDARAHLQATGIDARGRKQYRYHNDFRQAQEDAKFNRCADFGKALPAIRQAVEAGITGRGISKDRVIAAVVRLLDRGHLRVGNKAYARDNSSFGATTLRTRHIKVQSNTVKLDYVGKSGKRQQITLEDKRLVSVIRRCQELPGHMLFQYLDDEGIKRPVMSDDINEWLREHSKGNFTAKHFRTWGASVIAFDMLARADENLKLKDMLLEVSAKLGNTPAIARKSYIHPALIEAVQEGRDMTRKLPRPTKYLNGAERGLITFLEDECNRGEE
jgi:DNA topoisomerase I